MSKINLKSLSIGLAIFSMFFGAGNIIYPLAVGQYAGDQNIFAISGLILTAAVMPVAGLIAMLLFDGNIREFFGRLGKIPGFILSLIIISLLGPLGSTPRCIALSYVTVKSSMIDISPTLFSALSCVLLYLFTIKKRHILSLLGYVLTPLLLASLVAIIIIGLITTPEIATHSGTPFQLFLHGLNEGYNTMDLLAAFFFSSSILQILKLDKSNENNLKTAFQASLIGAILLALIYIGFSTIASFHGNNLSITGNEELLSAITLKIAGPYAGMLVCAAIALACLTTAIALISAFTDFMETEVFKKKISYETLLGASLLLTFVISTFEFTAISSYLWPILQLAYPTLIVLTLMNIIYKLTGFKTIKAPVAITFGLTLLSSLI